MLNFRCNLPNLANKRQHKSTNYNFFFRFAKVIKICVKKLIREEMTVVPSIFFSRKAVIDEKLITNFPN